MPKEQFKVLTFEELNEGDRFRVYFEWLDGKKYFVDPRIHEKIVPDASGNNARQVSHIPENVVSVSITFYPYSKVVVVK